MDEKSNRPQTVSLKSLTDGQSLTLKGSGEYIIGLTAEDQVKSKIVDSEDTDDIIVPLLKLTVWKTSGTTVAPISRDLPCMISGEPMSSEVNLIAGSVIEIGDKQLEFVDGPVAAPRRRCLPPTPGRPIQPMPPPKPQRAGICEEKTHNQEPDKPLLPDDWVVVDFPISKDVMLKQIHEPEQLASLAASYMTKHIHFHTDACVNAELTDQVFKLMLEVAYHRRDILQTFISGVMVNKDMNHQKEIKEFRSLHAIFIVLLREILQQFLDPPNLVVVSLQILRALSHIPDSAPLLVNCQVTSAVLGSMAALKSAVMVQQYSLDILAKIAVYHPRISEKAPLRESAIDLVCLSLEAHQEKLTIAQAGCRVLSTLVNTMYTVLTKNLDNGVIASNELQEFVSNLFNVMEYLFSKCVNPVQKILESFGHDLTIKCDSRHFFFIFSKLEHLKTRKEQWIAASSLPVELEESHFSSLEDMPDGDAEDDGDIGSSKGIMKRSRSFENLRTSERKVKFDEQPVSSLSASPDDVSEEILSQQLLGATLPASSSNGRPAEENHKNCSDILSHTQAVGHRTEAEGMDSSFNFREEYENWGSLLGVQHKKATLEDHSYSSGDIFFLRQLTKTQVLVLVFSLAVDGKERQALNLIEEPLIKIMTSSVVPLGIQQFIKRQSLAFEMAQKSVLGVLQKLDDSQHAAVVDVGVEFLVATFASRPLAPAVTAKGFVDLVCKELEHASEVSQNRSALKFLMSEIMLRAEKPSS
ncbi:hypothetical protein C0Q70_14849 [Pomacea canaliculata]|uniref:Uncharacterized protein n=1 Tax=Pomacea canaliculata TaxID=400727 RepID=A0A2T7NT67_POMCA|nr:hypothetical protein C0Q70_14849 [Pomacea canaliculata]